MANQLEELVKVYRTFSATPQMELRDTAEDKRKAGIYNFGLTDLRKDTETKFDGYATFEKGEIMDEDKAANCMSVINDTKEYVAKLEAEAQQKVSDAVTKQLMLEEKLADALKHSSQKKTSPSMDGLSTDEIIKELWQSRTDMAEELKETKSELKETQSALKETQSALKETQSALKETQSTLTKTEVELERLNRRIGVIEGHWKDIRAGLRTQKKINKKLQNRFTFLEKGRKEMLLGNLIAQTLILLKMRQNLSVFKDTDKTPGDKNNESESWVKITKSELRLFLRKNFKRIEVDVMIKDIREYGRLRNDYAHEPISNSFEELELYFDEANVNISEKKLYETFLAKHQTL